MEMQNMQSVAQRHTILTNYANRRPVAYVVDALQSSIKGILSHIKKPSKPIKLGILKPETLCRLIFLMLILCLFRLPTATGTTWLWIILRWLRSSYSHVLRNRCSSQYLQKNTCAGASFLIKLQFSGLQLYLKRESETGVFLWILKKF